MWTKRNYCTLLWVVLLRTGVDGDEKAYAWTDSEIAADALTEILYDLGCEEFHELNSKRPDYRRDNIVIDGCWRAVFTEM